MPLDAPAPRLPWSHRQWSWLVPVVGVLVAPLLAIALHGTLAWTVGAIALLGLAQVTCLTLRLDDCRLRIAFGPGLIRRDVELASIESFRAVRNRWYWGWGIRLYPGGRLYNVAGLDAVELHLAGGQQLRVGTDRPDLLLRALEKATGKIAAGPNAPAPPPPPSALRKYRALGVLAVAIPVALAVAFVLEEREPRVAITGNALHASSFVYSVEMNLGRVESLRLIDALPRIHSRTNGYALGGTLRGHFATAEGARRLFVEADRPPFVQVTADGVTLIVGFDSPDATRALHRTLEAALAERR